MLILQSDQKPSILMYTACVVSKAVTIKPSGVHELTPFLQFLLSNRAPPNNFKISWSGICNPELINISI